MAAITIEEALKKFDRRFYSYHVNQDRLSIFSENVKRYVDMTIKAIHENESEEHLKNITNSFLKAIYSAERYEINTDKRIDSTIKVDGKVQAIIETKKPTNKSEMVTENKINVKALHEILFYYMVETRDVTGSKVKRLLNTEIRRCIITNTQTWVIIDANEIEKVVDGYLEKLFYKYQNHQLIYSNNTDKFYEDTKQYLETIGVNDRLPYIFFTISDYRPVKKMQYLYKVFQKTFLLKDSSRYNESTHVLNDKFYQELLYLMGLKEKSGKSNKTIEIDHTISNSLANQVYSILKNDKEYDEISCIEKTFELVIIWMNRLLFIKLFEGQLITFNGDEKAYHILDSDKIIDFQNLQDLFFEVLGKKERDDNDFIKKFEKIPYLNSSLFERYDIEKQELNINAMKNEMVAKKKNSVVGTKTNTEIPILDYLIAFLNSYSFSSEISKNDTVIAGRDIIDASVLGLIFEKLNGYRDGSFYTPSVITEYMCMKYRMFICRCFSLLKNDGHCCLIFPLAFMGDATNSKIRQFVMENTQVDFIEAFPERDIESKRVFKEVKMSVCILGATKRKVPSSYKFSVRIHRDKYVDDNNEAMFISYDEIKAIDNKYLSIPLIRQHELSIFLKMTNECKRMSEISKCYTGEIDISLHSEFITNSSSDHSMLRGAQVQKYYITNDISQGDILFLKADGYLDKNKGEKSQHHNRRRIVMQGITGVNEKWRLKMTMAQPPYFCANSVNYLIPDMPDDFDYFILGILNSKLLNWYFAKLSTNSNVNGYEIDGLPIKMGTVEQRNEIIQLVGELLQSYDEIKVKEIDDIVYQIYGITEYEKPIIEG